MLYPKSNKYRDLYNLNGVWKFALVDENFEPKTALVDYALMPVPASMNDITTDKKVKDYVGKVVYETTFSLPVREKRAYRVRVGATSHKAKVYLNGEYIGEVINGFFPADLPLAGLKDENRLSIVIDNRLTFQTFPTGNVVAGKQIINHDFYNFTGIHRDVLVYSTAEKCIKDIRIKTVVEGDYSALLVEVDTDCSQTLVKIKDKTGEIVAEGKPGTLRVENPNLWSPENPYLYTAAVETECDIYEERFGIRKLQVTDREFLLNDKPIYFKGFGMHEDFFVLGKGNNTAVNIRNFELLKWTGANSFRTTHYPYAEEIMELADEYGIMVIDEVPAVGMNWWMPNEGKHWFDDGAFRQDRINDETKELHKKLIKQMLERDKNHPCVVAISVANEAATHEKASYPYFKEVIEFTRSVCDLPVTIVEYSKMQDYEYVKSHGGGLVPALVDFIGINRYYGWYYNHADTEMIYEPLKSEMESLHKEFKKPIMITEFGADTIEGLHALPSESFSDEFQREYLEENCKAIDECEFCIGEHVWNLFDFKTKQGLTRVRGNRKGIFTKDRQPKASAFFLKNRWKNK